MEDDRSGEPSGANTGVYAEVYGHYFDAVYDYAIRIAQDRDIAALVVQSSFLRLFKALSAGQAEAADVQLFSGAHHDVTARLRGRRGAAEAVEEPYAGVDASRVPAAVDDVSELGRMVWSAAVEMKINDYELLDLNVRHRLETVEIGTVLGQRPEAVERRLFDAHGTLERALGARLLFTRGRRECMDLDFQLGDVEWSKSMERRCWRHADSCTICQATVSTFPRASDVLAALLPVPAPGGWRETMLDRLEEAMRGQPAPVAPAPAAARPEPTPQAPAAPPAVSRPEPTPEPEPTAPVARPAMPPVTTRQAAPRQQPSYSSYPGYGGGGGGRSGDWLDSLFGGGGPRGPILGALLGGLIAAVVVIAALCAAGSIGGGNGETKATPTGTLTPTAEASGTPTRTITPTLTPTPPPAVDTDTPVPTDTPPPADTDTPVPTNTNTPTHTNTPAVSTNTPPPAASPTP